MDAQKAGERELEKYDETRRSLGMLGPLRDKNEVTSLGGGRDNTCDRGLSRSWRVRLGLNLKKTAAFDPV